MSGEEVTNCGWGGHVAVRSVWFFSIVGGAKQLGRIVGATGLGSEVELMHYDLG